MRLKRSEKQKRIKLNKSSKISILLVSAIPILNWILIFQYLDFFYRNRTIGSGFIVKIFSLIFYVLILNLAIYFFLKKHKKNDLTLKSSFFVKALFYLVASIILVGVDLIFYETKIIYPGFILLIFLLCFSTLFYRFKIQDYKSIFSRILATFFVINSVFFLYLLLNLIYISFVDTEIIDLNSFFGAILKNLPIICGKILIFQPLVMFPTIIIALIKGSKGKVRKD